MRGKLLLGLLAPLAMVCFVPAALSGEETAGQGESPEAKGRTYYSTQLLEEVNKNIEKHKAEGEAREKAATKAKVDEWNAEFQKVIAPQEGKFEYDGKPVTFKEPRKPEDVKYEPGTTYKPWSLKAEDFAFDLPVEVFERQPEGAAGRERTYVVLPYTITNSLAENKLLTPRITMVTDGGVTTAEVCGFVPHESVEVSTMLKRAWTAELVGFAREKAEHGAIEAGQTKAGVAVFPRYDPGTTSVRFLIEGLADELNFKKDLRKVMVLEFVRPGNIYYPGQVKLAFKRRIGGKLIDPKAGYLPARDDDVHHGFDWVWLWNWDVAAKVAEAPKASEMDSPTGTEKQKFWCYKITIPNRTGEEQPLTIDKVSTIIDLEILGKKIEVPFVDDGSLDVYKTAFFEKEGKPVTGKRFPNGAKVSAGDDNAVSFWVAFRESDFDFEAVCRNLTAEFNLDLARARNAGGEKMPYEVVAGVAKFDAAKMAQARKELLEKIPAALAAQLKERVVAAISAKSGLASGTRVMNRSLYQPAFTPAETQK